jgi:hypothetical protein
MRTYVTFGQIHEHFIGDNYFNKDCVAIIECSSFKDGRKKTFELFGDRFFTTYFDESWNENNLKLFPRGYIYV